MSRPKRIREINFFPEVTYFKPQGVPISLMDQIDLTIDELESMRLSDIDELKMDDAAKKMGISKSTFCRTLNTAHKKTAEAFIKGKAIKIHNHQDFNFLNKNNMPKQDGTGPNGEGPRTGRSLGPCDPAENPKKGIPPRRGRQQGQGRS